MRLKNQIVMAEKIICVFGENGFLFKPNRGIIITKKIMENIDDLC